MRCLHLTADLYQCHCAPLWLRDAQSLSDWCVTTLERLGHSVQGRFGHTFEAVDFAGVQVTVLLNDGQLQLRTWSGTRLVMVDVHGAVLDDKQAAWTQELMGLLTDHFAPAWTERRSLDRGDDAG